MSIAVFVLCLVAAAYPVLLYPPLVLLASRVRRRSWVEASVSAPVVHIVTVHNEEARIRRKLENTLALHAPEGGLRTIVAGDGSSDGTEEIVREFSGRGVAWIGHPRRGKEAAQVETVRRTVEPIVVFSDAAALLEPQAIVELLRPFADREIAAVSGTDLLEGSGAGEDLYVRYEMALRQAESLAGSLVGLSGCFFATRREVAESLSVDVPSDMGAALVAIAMDKRAVDCRRATCRYEAASEVGREFARKRRTALRGMRCLWAYRRALSPMRPLVSWQVVSHKGMRFAVPWFLLGALGAVLAGAALGEGWAVGAATFLLAAVVAGAVSLGSKALRKLHVARALGFALLGSAAVLAAWFDLLRGQTHVTWAPTERPGVHR